MRLENTQSFNRYSYVWNNPLRYNDPSGEVMLPGGYNYTNVNTNVNTNYNYNQWQQESAPTIAPLWIGNEYTDIIGSMEEILYATGVGVSNEQQYMATQMHSPPSSDAITISLEIIAWGDDIDSEIFYAPAGAQDIIGEQIDNHICYAKDMIDLTQVNPSTLGRNWFGLHYPGSNNPLKYNEDYDYSVEPKDISGYPAIGHDRRYDNLKITGKEGLFLDMRAIGADWQFVKEELSIAFGINTPMKSRAYAYVFGMGLAYAVYPKTMYHILTNPVATMNYVSYWYNVSNVGVTNQPSP